MSDLDLFEPIDGPRGGWPARCPDRAYLEAFASQGSTALIANLRTKVMGLRSGGRVFPVTINEAEYGDHNGAEFDALKLLVSSPSIYEYIQPYTHGYELAYQAREALRIDHYTAFVDIEKILESLGITIRDESLQTNSVRGVAIAGKGFSPAILVNRNSIFNENKRGRRFTLAHEFCHILHDRSSARRLSHIERTVGVSAC